VASPWQQAVWRAARRVPRGRVTTYGDIAALLGHPGRARQVGGALGALPGADVVARASVPWYLFVNARGFLSIRGAFVGKDTQRALLVAEGIDVDDAYVVVGFASLRWRFAGPDGVLPG